MREMVSMSTFSCRSWDRRAGTKDRMTAREKTSRTELFVVEMATMRRIIDERSGVGINRGLYNREAATLRRAFLRIRMMVWLMMVRWQLVGRIKVRRIWLPRFS